jgi:hypothetical protein
VEKSHSLAMPVLALACLLLFACQTPGKASRVNFRRPAITMRTVLYATLAVILLVVLAAIAAERIGRRNRRLSPSPLTARR